jgi:hypothetical protein
MQNKRVLLVFPLLKSRPVGGLPDAQHAQARQVFFLCHSIPRASREIESPRGIVVVAGRTLQRIVETTNSFYPEFVVVSVLGCLARWRIRSMACRAARRTSLSLSFWAMRSRSGRTRASANRLRAAQLDYMRASADQAVGYDKSCALGLTVRSADSNDARYEVLHGNLAPLSSTSA